MVYLHLDLKAQIRRLSVHRRTTVDCQNLPRDEITLRAGEKDAGTDYVLGYLFAFDRAGCRPLGDMGSDNILCQHRLRHDAAGRNCIGPDTVIAQFAGNRSGERDDSPLGCVVVQQVGISL